MKLIKLKKQEREKMIERILDCALDNASVLDVEAELRMYLKSGLPSGVIPYKEKTDEALIMDFMKTLNLLDVLDGDEMDRRYLFMEINGVTTSKLRAEKIIKYLKQK